MQLIQDRYSVQLKILIAEFSINILETMMQTKFKVVFPTAYDEFHQMLVDDLGWLNDKKDKMDYIIDIADCISRMRKG